jgi:hypothetical protein
MTTINYSSRVADPTAFVTRGRQRVKQYGNIVYLKNGEEFELELFNPTQSKVLAKIKINGNYISSSGIILRPGERVFLERYFDEAKKFLFETYEVNGSDPNVLQAIKNNGDVEIEFYSEFIRVNYTNHNNWSYFGNTQPGVRGISTTGDFTATCYCSNNADMKSFEPVETGRVEKGEDSNQTFSYDSTQFNDHTMCKSVWKIMPESTRPIVKEDLAVYCTNCGAKRKKTTHKFCPSCGTKF